MSAMTVEPAVPALPAGVLGNPPAADLGAAAAFAQAIQLALGGVTVPTTAPADAKAEGQETDAQTTDADSATDANAAGLADPALAAVLMPTILPVAALTAGPTTPPKDEPVTLEAATALSSAGTAPTQVETTATPVTTDAGSDSATPDQSQDGAADTATAPAPAPAAPEPTAPAPQTASQVTTLAPATAPTDTATAPAPRAVAGQVIPEVTKLFSNGEGVHRVTLELNPKALGEVRVVLTVRHGDVHVRLAAGSEAREALALASNDLTRALEHIGVKEHRLTLAELPGVSAASAPQTHSDTTEQRDQNPSFTGRFDTQHHHDSRQPRMGDGSTATDGTDHDHGSRIRGDRSIHEVSHVPSRGGVDLRM